MMGAVRGWLLAVIAASLLCALADALMPRGAVKRVGKLVCGLVLMAAMLSPAVSLDLAEGQSWLEDYFAQLHGRAAELGEAVNREQKAIIERECGAYIVDKAAEFGWTCTARVVCEPTEEGVCLPVRAEVSGPLTEEAQARLRRILAEDLGIPEEAQFYSKEEGMP